VDLVKVKALCPDAAISCLQYSNFLLWSGTTLTALCSSALGKSYGEWLPVHLRHAFDEILADPDMSDISSDASGNESLPGSETNEQSL
jgi:hypothetical protein